MVLEDQELYGLEDIRANQNVPHKLFAEKLATEVEIVGVKSLDNKTALIVGEDFTGPGDGRTTMQCHVHRLRELQQSLNCLQSGEGPIVKEECVISECDDCFSREAVCEACMRAGFTHWCPALKNATAVWLSKSRAKVQFASTKPPIVSRS